MGRIEPQVIEAGELARLPEAGAVGPLGKFDDFVDDVPSAVGVEDSEIDVLRAIVTQVSGNEGSQGLVSIWKKDDKTTRMVYVGEADPSEFLADGPQNFLAEHFGAGEFELKVYTSERKILKRPRVTISKLAVDFINRKKGSNSAASVFQGVGNSDIAELGKIMANGFMQLGQLIARSQPPAQSRMEVLQEIGQMKAIFGGGNSGADPVEMFTKLAGVFKSMQPRGENDGVGGFLDLADRFLPLIKDTLVTAREGASLALPPAAVASPGQPVRPLAVPPDPVLTPEQQGAKNMSLQLKMQLVYLCSEAARDVDPAPYAEIIVGKVPREVLDTMLADNNWLDSLAKFHDKVKQFPQWFGELRELVLEELAQESLPASEKGDISTETLPGLDDVFESDGRDTN